MKKKYMPLYTPVLLYKIRFQGSIHYIGHILISGAIKGEVHIKHTYTNTIKAIDGAIMVLIILAICIGSTC